LAKLEYDLLEDLKKTKAKISLFEIMKIPQIQENFIRTLQGKTYPIFRESNSGTKRVITKLTSPNKNIPSKSQVATNASLVGQGSRSNTPPFLITFEIFNRNVEIIAWWTQELHLISCPLKSVRILTSLPNRITFILSSYIELKLRWSDNSRKC
jgi:hypothetical protein